MSKRLCRWTLSSQGRQRLRSLLLVLPLRCSRSRKGDASAFMGFYSPDDLVDLEEWARRSRELRGTAYYVMVEPGISDNLRLFLRYTEDSQWQYKMVHPSGEVLLFQLRAYLKGFELLTPFNRRQWVRLFSAWTLSERREQLDLLPNSGGSFILYILRALCWVVGRSRPAALFYCLVPVSVVKILELHKKIQR